MRRLLLIDGSSFAYKAFFAIRHLSAPDGTPTNATYGFLSMLDKAQEQLQPAQTIAVFDMPEPTFRHERYPEYKATRDKAPEDLVSQLPWIKDILRARGIAVIEQSGYEADDIMGTLAQQRQRWQFDEAIIATSDKDLAQLVQPGIALWDSKTERLLDAEGVKGKLGVRPDQVVDYLAIVGDSSDNIPGVRGIGPKGALKLLQEYETLDGIYAQIENISGAARTRLENARDLAQLSRELVSLYTRVPLDEHLLQPGTPDWDTLHQHYSQLGFRGLRDQAAKQTSDDNNASTASSLPGCTASLVCTRDAFDQMLADIGNAQLLALDTETTSLNPRQAELVGISLACGQHAWYLPFGHRMADNLPGALLPQLMQHIDRPDMCICMQNAKFDLAVLQNADVPLEHAQLFDTMIASYLIDPNRQSHSLDNLARDQFGHEMIPYSDLVPKGQDFADTRTEDARDYATEDAWVCLQLYHRFAPQIESNFPEIFNQLEMPLVGVLQRMEARGILLDTQALHRIDAELSAELDRCETRIYEAAGQSFNINSPKQLGAVLFESMGIPPVKRTKTGYSTDVRVLESLAAQGYEIAQSLLEYRSTSKLLGTYVRALPKLIDPQTQRIHTSFNQTITNTGRLSSSEPNLQNIPIRTANGRRIRSAFVPAEGMVLVSADYSQIELRIAAHLSNDPTMVRTFREGGDIHSQTARDILGSDSAENRHIAKAVNFGILYGMSAFKLANDLGIARSQAQAIIDGYFTRYAGIRTMVEQAIAQARETGYAETPWGRRRPLPDIHSRNRNLREAAERNAINMPIQGACADIIKRAMIDIDAQLAAYGAHMLLQIHDELVFEVPRENLDGFSRELETRMRNAAELRVPLDVSLSHGASWAEVH